MAPIRASSPLVTPSRRLYDDSAYHGGVAFADTPTRHCSAVLRSTSNLYPDNEELLAVVERSFEVNSPTPNRLLNSTHGPSRSPTHGHSRGPTRSPTRSSAGALVIGLNDDDHSDSIPDQNSNSGNNTSASIQLELNPRSCPESPAQYPSHLDPPPRLASNYDEASDRLPVGSADTSKRSTENLTTTSLDSSSEVS